MEITRLTDTFAVSPQVRPEDIDALAASGFRSLVCNRPDHEEPGQPTFAELAEAARSRGLAVAHVPVGGGVSPEDQAAQFAECLATMPAPMLAFCRTGNRSRQVHEAAQALVRKPAAGDRHHCIVIAGGGSGGLGAAASLLKRRPDLDLAVIEPSDKHYYQPGYTMVGGGVFDSKDMVRAQAQVMPRRAQWIRASVVGFEPEANAVRLDDGTRVTYDVLILAMGNRLAWDEIQGLEATLGKNGVTSNYRYDLAPYTWELVQATRRGRALFTQPPMPIKCAGAPQKAMYLSCSEWERQGVLDDIQVEFHNHGGVLFGVPDYVPALMQTVERYGIGLNFGSDLVKVDGEGRRAWFRTEAGMVERTFDMLHVCPPQKGNAVVAASVLADGAGYAQVDPHSLRHVRFDTVFALGDCGNTGNAKTMAAARKQAPVVALNVLATLDGKPLTAGYDGYGSCPLTVEKGKIVLAEFTYGGKVAPTFPDWLNDGTRPTSLAWHLKADVLPALYWHGMLKGREWLAMPMGLSAA